MDKLDRLKQREKKYRERKSGVLTDVKDKIQDKVEDLVIDYAKDRTVKKLKDFLDLIFSWIRVLIKRIKNG